MFLLLNLLAVLEHKLFFYYIFVPVMMKADLN